ncbi:response regulator [Neptunitalea lumnitzerae]|uniref:Response regulator transcription factor n=1 Tax=Neptunitalea lumnitzerae TaxID=2965509 RepID=A0ABQ5MGL5_9FLAO|nr:response regulator transcription factor [Neptunitalea sp. Y10]GLB48570.1 response regulator transcription factor [Neptunitalea sp. Y10]
MQTKINVTLVDDHQLVTDLLKDYLNKTPEIKVTNAFYNGNDFLDHLNEHTAPDILVLDLKMQNGNGKKVIAIITQKFPEIKIIVLTSFYQPNYLGFMFQLGVHAFLPKELPKENLVTIIKEVKQKGFYFDNEQMLTLRKQISKKTPELVTDTKEILTEREMDVLKLLCLQMTAQEIADKLFISKKTVETHKANLILKTGTKNTAGLVIFAAKNKLIDLDEFPLL